MENVISFTPLQLCTMFIAICGGVITIAGAFSVLQNSFKAAKAPLEKTEERLAAIETRLAKHDALFDNDKQRFESLEEGNRITQRAILALLAHGIDGNEVDQLKDAKNELQDFLIRR